jgi:hypothetical protein
MTPKELTEKLKENYAKRLDGRWIWIDGRWYGESGELRPACIKCGKYHDEDLSCRPRRD